MVPIVTAEEMRAIDHAAPEPVDQLIERAGRAVARTAITMLGGTYGRVVNVIAGTGNNGADARHAAVLLRSRGVKVRMFDVATCPSMLPTSHLVIDGAFGTGYAGNRMPWQAPGVGTALVLAVDIPSGLDSLTGTHAGSVVMADRTITFQALKPGLLLGDGPACCGEIELVDIGLDVSSSMTHLVERADVAGWWPWRRRDTHKWNSAVRVIAGSDGMLGAARLCAAAALRAGAGLVAVSSPGVSPGARDELVQPPIGATEWAQDVLVDLMRFGSLVIGPGLGRSEVTIAEIRRLIADATVPVVIDGDGLFAAAWSADGAASLLGERTLPTVLTPHDGEFAVLTGSRPGLDRIGAVRKLAGDVGCTVLLKGPTTLVAEPGGEVLVVDHGDERLATAGSGDVLAGVIAMLLASGVSPLRAAASAAWLHAEASQCFDGPGLVAGDLLDALPVALAHLFTDDTP